jgi:hypothetical protein
MLGWLGFRRSGTDQRQGRASELGEAVMPDAFVKADKASTRQERRFLRWTKWLLLLNVAAAAAGALALSKDHTKQAALVATIFFAGGLALMLRLALQNPKRRWYDLRAAAESAKTLAVQYAVGGGPFAINAGDVDHEYRGAVHSIPAALPNLPPLGYEDDPVTPGLQAIRSRPFAERKEIYLEDRVEDQRRWYSTRAETNALFADRWRSAMFFGQLLGLGGGAARALNIWDVNLLGIAAALTAAAAAWARTNDYEGLAEAYNVTARELAGVKQEGEDVGDEDGWAPYVADAESAFSREHTLWLARRG